MMSEKEYNSIQETEYLLQNEENRKFLVKNGRKPPYFNERI